MLITLVLTGAMFTSVFQSTMNGNQVQENILLDLSMGLVADYYVVHDPILIGSDADFASQGWSGSGTPEDPYLIEGLSIEGAFIESCIEIEDTRAYFVVSNCLLYGAEGFYWAGLSLTNVTNGLIEHNNCTQNDNGIYLTMSTNNIIRSNELYDNEGKGIYLSDSDNNTLADNDCSDNTDGIYVYDSDEVNILNNTVNQNFDDGIYVSGGIVSHSRDCTIANNTCEGNRLNGIQLRRYASGVVTNNTCSGNSDGISLMMSMDISVTWNALIDNERNGYEMSTTAILFDYNYWSDYTGVDEDGDGIGDTPYEVIYYNIVDNHPLMYWPWHEPTTTTTTDETTDGDDQPISPVIVGTLIGAVCIIIVIVLVQSRRK